MLRKVMITSGVALAVVTAGCATAPAEKPAAAAPAASASASAAPAAPAMSAAVVAAQAPGEATFKATCFACHGTGANNAPAVSVLAAKEPAAIVEALTTGKMAPMGAALSAEAKANVAMYLTKKPV